MLQFGREKGRAEEPWKNNNQSPPIFDILLPFSCRNGLSLPLNICWNHFFFLSRLFLLSSLHFLFSSRLSFYFHLIVFSCNARRGQEEKQRRKHNNNNDATTKSFRAARFSADPGAAGRFCASSVSLSCFWHFNSHIQITLIQITPHHQTHSNHRAFAHP